MAEKWDRKYPLYIYINPDLYKHYIMVPLMGEHNFAFWTDEERTRHFWVPKSMNLRGFNSSHKILTPELLFLHGDNLESYKFIDEFLLDFC